MLPATVTSLPTGTQINNNSSASANVGGANQTLTESDFLTLLTTQLENQNPLNPQNPSDFAAELAQFSTAAGVSTLNTSFGTDSGMQAAGLVGKNVAVSGNALVLGSGGSAQGAFKLSGAAADVKVTVTNSSGSVVNVIDLGPMGAGNQSFTWNGQSLGGTAATAGTYSYSINATASSGSTTPTVTSYSVVPVTSVVLGGTNGPTLNLGGGVAPVALSAVQQVF
ncbi:MAG TPA: FlgD immunoglobulin-like domain containing protein [Stellaceae bacterium]|nr:FlgD immunoglobulin-like domain containing protein [Stellaceae bacterium]